MGATAHLKSVTQDLVELFQTHPRLVEPFLCGLPTALPPGLPAAFREQLLKSLDRPDRLEWLSREIEAICPEQADAILAQTHEAGLNLEKHWQELAPCIAGDSQGQSPLGRCILGGAHLGPNLGYGPARMLSHSEVAETSAALEDMDVEEFRIRAQGVGIPANSVDFFQTVFDALRQYYRQAAHDQKAMLLSMA